MNTPKEYADFIIKTTKEAKEKSSVIVIVEMCETLNDIKTLEDLKQKQIFMRKVRKEIANRLHELNQPVKL